MDPSIAPYLKIKLGKSFIQWYKIVAEYIYAPVLLYFCVDSSLYYPIMMGCHYSCLLSKYSFNSQVESEEKGLKQVGSFRWSNSRTTFFTHLLFPFLIKSPISLSNHQSPSKATDFLRSSTSMFKEFPSPIYSILMFNS